MARSLASFVHYSQRQDSNRQWPRRFSLYRNGGRLSWPQNDEISLLPSRLVPRIDALPGDPDCMQKVEAPASPSASCLCFNLVVSESNTYSCRRVESNGYNPFCYLPICALSRRPDRIFHQLFGLCRSPALHICCHCIPRHRHRRISTECLARNLRTAQ